MSLYRRKSSPQDKYSHVRATWNPHHYKFEAHGESPFFHLTKIMNLSGLKIPGGSLANECKRRGYSRRDALLVEVERLSNDQPIYLMMKLAAQYSGMTQEEYLAANPDVAKALPKRLTRREIVRIARENVSNAYGKSQ